MQGVQSSADASMCAPEVAGVSDAGGSPGEPEMTGPSPLKCGAQLPVHDSPDSSAGASSEGMNSTSCPGRLRELARRTLSMIPEISVPNLPCASSVTGASFLAWYAGNLVVRGKITDQPMRVVRKGGLHLNHRLLQVAADPSTDYTNGTIQWGQRQRAGHTAAALFAEAYGLTVRDSRKRWSKLWLDTSVGEKNNWVYLVECDGYTKMKDKLEALQDRPAEDESEELSCVGAVLTWQSALGRDANCTVRKWVEAGFSVETMAELMQQDAECETYFKVFCSTVVSMAKRNGFKHCSCCMELNPSRTDAVVHFHAYVCVDWKHWSGPKKAMVTVVKEDWSFGGYVPSVETTNVRRNANPQKVMTGALLYCSIPKVGSVFHYGTLVPGKDSEHSALCNATPEDLQRV